MFLAWVRFSILISNIILSNELSPPAIMTGTKCAIENQRIQGFTPSQFFQCVKNENKLYFETRYCPNVKNTFYETEQRCLPNIGGGEVRCLITGKRCSHNKLGPMAYPNKFKPNYYIVCLPKATHICRCYENAIYDASTQMCRNISTTTDMGRDDSNGVIPKIICERSGIHSTVELEYPNKQKCALFCYQKYTNEQFKLNIICEPKTNLVDANVPTINPSDIDSTTSGEENLPPEIRELIAQELLKSTIISYDNLGWVLEKSTTEISQDEEKRKRTDITSIPTEETILGSSSTEDVTITWVTDQNIEERSFDPFYFKYDETTSKKMILTNVPAEVDSWSSDISHTVNDKATSTPLSEFSSAEDELDKRTTEKVTSQDGSVQRNSDKILIPFLKDDETTIQARETLSASSTIQDDTTPSVTNQNFKENRANITEYYGNVQSITDKNVTQTTSSSLFLVTEDGSPQSTIDNNFNERTSSTLILTTDKGTTITSVNYKTEDVNTKWTTNQNTIQTPSTSQFTTTEDIIKSSTKINSLTSLIHEDGNSGWTTNQNFEKSTASTLSTAIEDKTTNQFSENILLASVTPERESMQSTAYQNFTETSETQFSTTNDGLKETNPGTNILITEDESTKFAINQNTIETTSSSQFLTTAKEKIISTTDITSLASLISEDGEIQWTTDQNFKKSTANPLSTIMIDETTNQFKENLLFSSVTPEEGSVQSTTYRNFKETSSIPFSATDDGMKETNPTTKLLLIEEETSNPPKTIITTLSNTGEDRSTKWTLKPNIIETSSSSQFFTTEDKITSTSDKTSLASSIPEDRETQRTTDQNFKKSTANPLSTIIVDETTNQSTADLLLVNVTPEGVNLQSTAYPIFTETSKTSFSTIDDGAKATNYSTIVIPTEEETTNPSKTIITLVSDTTEDKNTKWTINQNTTETSSISQFFTTKDILKLSSDETSLASVIPEDGKTQRTTDQYFEKSTPNTLSSILEDEITNQSSENLLLASATSEGGSIQSTAHQTFIETSEIPYSTADDGPKETNSATLLIVTERETTNPFKAIITSVTDTSEDKDTKWTTNQNTIETSSRSPLLTTEDIINTSRDKITLVSLTPENGETHWTAAQNFKKSTANTLSTPMGNEIIKQFRENTLVATVTPEGETVQSIPYQNFKETTSNILFSTTFDSGLKITNSDTILLIPDADITNQSNENILLASVTPEGESLQSNTYQDFKDTSGTLFLTTDNNLKETNSSTPLLTTGDEINQSNENLLLTTVTPEAEIVQSTTYQDFKEIPGTPFLTTDDNLKETNSDTPLLTAGDEINQSNENILLTTATPEGEIVQSTISIYNQDFKETSGTPLLTTDDNLKETNSGSLLLTSDDEITNQSNEIILLTTVTPEGEIVHSTTYQDFQGPFLTTDDNLKETNSGTPLLTTGDEINQSNENILLTTATPEGEIVQSTTYQDFQGPFLTTDDNLKETNSGTPLLTTDDEITNQSNENLLLAGVTTEAEIVQSTTYPDFKETSGIPLLTTDNNLKETNSDTSLLTDDEITNQSNENISLAGATTEGESAQSTTYQDFKETSATTFSTTADNLKETNSGTSYLTINDEITNQSNENLLLVSITPKVEIVQSTIYQDFKETSGTPFLTTDDNLKEINSVTSLLTTNDEITNQSKENLLLVSITPKVEIVQSTIYQDFKETSGTPFLTTDDNLKEINSGTPLLTTDDEITNQSNEIILLATATPEGESVHSTTYQDFKETSGTPFSTTDAILKETNSGTLLLTTDDEITNQSNENLLLVSIIPKGEIVHSTTYQDFKATSGTPFLTTDENLQETHSGNPLLTTSDEINQSNENLLLTTVTPEGQIVQSTTYQDFKEIPGTPFLTTDDNLKETRSGTPLLTTDDEITNQSNENLLLAGVTTEGEIVQSTTYPDFKETSGIPLLTTDNNLKETNSDTSLLTDDEITNQSNENLSLAGATTEGESAQSTTYQDFKDTSGNSFSTTADNLKETNSGTPLLTIGDEINQFNENLLLTTVTPEGEIVQSTTYQDFKETSGTPFLTTDDNLKETNSGTSLLTTNDGITNQSEENLLLVSITPKGEIVQSTIYQDFKETSGTPFSTTDPNLKERNSGTSLLTTGDEINQSNENILLVSVTPEGENVQSTTYQDFKETSGTTFSTTDDNLKETNSGTLLLTTDDEISNHSNKNLLLVSITPKGEIVQSTRYQGFKEPSGTPFLTTDDNLKETNSGTPLLTTDDEITNQSEENLLLVNITPKGEIVQSTIYQDFKETSGTQFSTTDPNRKETNSGTSLLTTGNEINQSNENILLVSVTPEGENVQFTTYPDFKETSGTTFSTTDENLKETNSGTLLLTTDDEITNHSNKNLLLVSVTPKGEIVQSTAYQDFKETSGTPFSTTEDNLKKTNSGTLLLTTDHEVNQSNKNLLLANVTPEGESAQSTTYQDIKETSGTPISTTDNDLKETNSDTLLLTKDEEITNHSNQNILLATVTPEGENVQSITHQDFKNKSSYQFSTTPYSVLSETNSGTLLLITEDVTTNESGEKFLLQSSTPLGESTQFTPYEDFKESISNSLFSSKEDGKVDFKQTTSIALSSIIEDEIIKSSSVNNLLASLITEDGSATSTPDEYSKQTTSSTRFSITDEAITPTSEIFAAESLSTENGYINSTENQNIQTKNFNNSFISPSTNEQVSTTESMNPGNWTELPGTEVTIRTEVLSSTNKQLKDKTTQEKLNTTPSPTTSELLTTETESEISTYKETSEASYNDGIKLNYTPSKSDQVTLNLENNFQSTIAESTSRPTILFSSITKLQETDTKVNALPSSSTEFTSSFASITPSLSSLSQISTTESSNWFSTVPILNDSENLKINIPNENLPSTSSPHSTSDTIVLSTAVTAFSKNDEENLLSTTSLNGYSQSISTTEDTAKPVDLSTTSENLFTTEIDTRLPVESSTASDYYEYQSIIPVSDITNSVNTLLPAEAISESTPDNSQQISTSLEPFDGKEYSTETLSTGYSSTTKTTAFIEPADSDTTESFTTMENVESNLNVEPIDSDQNINGSPKPNWDVSDETFTSETSASNEYTEEPEHDPSSQSTYFGLAERCECSGKRRYRNSCKKHYYCSKIGGLHRFIHSKIMECAHCFQFNAKKRICDFPENVPECAVDDGSFNRICTAEGNYSIPLERNCRKYYECKRNWRGVIVLRVKICQVGRIFSERLQKCVRGCRCRNAQQLPDRCEYKNAVLPDRFDCSKYYYCNNEMEMKTLQCSDQYVFDGEKCELKSEVICDPSKVYRYLSDDDDENCNT